LSTATRAKPFAASRAARVANKNAVSDMGSDLRFVPPQTQDQTYAATQQTPITIVFRVCLARDAAGRPGRDWRRGGRRGRCFRAFTPSRRGDEPGRQWAPARHGAEADVRQGSTPAPRPVRHPTTKATCGLRRRSAGLRRAADMADRPCGPAGSSGERRVGEETRLDGVPGRCAARRVRRSTRRRGGRRCAAPSCRRSCAGPEARRTRPPVCRTHGVRPSPDNGACGAPGGDPSRAEASG
jgi:hypothetical protein